MNKEPQLISWGFLMLLISGRRNVLKSTAAVLGFLFGLSTAYYLSFWSFFNINVFQYIAIEDIIKGIAYPLRFGGAWILGTVVLVIIVFIIIILREKDKKIVSPEAKGVLRLFIGSSIFPLITYLFFPDNLVMDIVISITLSVVIFALYFIIHEADKEEKKTAPDAEDTFIGLSTMLVAYSVIFLPINSIISGQVEARAIHSGKRYNYIVAQDLPKDKVKTTEPYLIFLGAVSENYIFIDKAENERFILDKDELPDLKIHYFDYADTASITHFYRSVGKTPALPAR